MKPNIKAHIALFCVALIYGVNYTIAKGVMNGGYIQPFGFILIRVFSGIVFFWIFHSLFIRERIERKDFPLFFLCAIFGVAINQLCFFSGLELTKPINAALIMTTTPILVLLISSIFVGEKITFQKMLGVIVGACGAGLLIAYGKELAFNRAQLWGDLLIFINASSYGVYLVLVKSLTKKYHPITIVKWVFTLGLLFVFPFGIGQFNVIDWASFSTSIWLAVAYVMFFTTVCTYLFNAYALSKVNASTVSMYIYLQPVFATTIALFLQADELNWIKIVSAVLIFAGVYLVSFSSQNSAKIDK